MSCLSEFLHGRDNAVACVHNWITTDVYNWITTDRILPVLGPYVSATVIFITFLATLRLTRNLKQSDTFIGFTNTFNEFMKEKELLRNGHVAGQTDPGADQLPDMALDFYGRFYGFNFSEYYAYKRGSLDRRIFTLWMGSRWREFRAPENRGENLLHTKTYRQGWKHWRKHFHRDATDDFTRLMEDIRRCKWDHRVPGLVRYYGPSLQPLYWLVRWPFVEVRYQLPRLFSALWTSLKAGWKAISRRVKIGLVLGGLALIVAALVYFWHRP